MLRLSNNNDLEGVIVHLLALIQNKTVLSKFGFGTGKRNAQKDAISAYLASCITSFMRDRWNSVYKYSALLIDYHAKT